MEAGMGGWDWRAVFIWVNLNMDRLAGHLDFSHTHNRHQCAHPAIPTLQASSPSSPGPLQMLFPLLECSSLLSRSTSFLLTSTQPSFPPAGVIRGASTFHNAVRSPDLFVHSIPQFSPHICLHNSVIWFPFKDLSLLTFPIHLINFSFFGGKRRK